MESFKTKVYDWKDRLKDRKMLSVVLTFIIIILILGLTIYKKQRDYRQTSENEYNMAFFELVNYVDNVETYLAKSLISSSAEHSAETLTYLWREADLAQSYLARLPIGTQELSNTSKFLNQVSDYSYSLSRKNIKDEELTQEELNNLKELHTYGVDLKNTLNQLSDEINEGTIKWKELTNKGTIAFAQEVSNPSKDSFSSVEENFHEYQSLIYDGAFSEHLTNPERKGLTGDNIDEERAKEIAIEIIGKDRIKEITTEGLFENGNIPAFSFNAKLNENDNYISISITQKGGHLIFLNSDRYVENEVISQEQANEIGINFLKEKGYNNMKETYFLKQGGMITINYAYKQDKTVVYSDLIKVKIALDNGEILGVEATGYLNSHTEREIKNIKVSKEEAKKNLNKDLEIMSEGLAIIPTQWKTEVLCWEFKGKVEDREFLVYINVETGEEQDILMIIDTPNGTLAM